MNEKIKLAIKGDVYIQSPNTPLLHLTNDIQAEAMDIVRRCITTGAPMITKVAVFDGLTLKTTTPITSVLFIGTNAVKLQLILSEESFEGQFNNLHLLSSNDLPFSKLENFTSIPKTFDNQIVIEWVLTLSIITA